MQLSSGSTTSLPTLKKLQASPQSPSKHHPLEKKATKSKRTRRPSSAGAPPLLHVIQQADKMVAVREDETVSPGESGWEYCSLPIASEMAECLAGQTLFLHPYPFPFFSLFIPTVLFFLTFPSFFLPFPLFSHLPSFFLPSPLFSYLPSFFLTVSLLSFSTTSFPPPLYTREVG